MKRGNVRIWNTYIPSSVFFGSIIGLGGVRFLQPFSESPVLPCPMCFAAMAMAGIEEVFYAYSNEDGEPYGLSSASLYAQLARPAAERSLKMTYVRIRPDGEKDAYELWRRTDGLSDAGK